MDEWKDAWLDGWINDMNKTHLGTPNVEKTSMNFPWKAQNVYEWMKCYGIEEMFRGVGMGGMLQNSWNAYGSW